MTLAQTLLFKIRRTSEMHISLTTQLLRRTARHEPSADRVLVPPVVAQRLSSQAGMAPQALAVRSSGKRQIFVNAKVGLD